MTNKEASRTQKAPSKKVAEVENLERRPQRKWLTLSIVVFVLFALCVAVLFIALPDSEEMAQRRVAEAEADLRGAGEQYESARTRLAESNEASEEARERLMQANEDLAESNEAVEEAKERLENAVSNSDVVRTLEIIENRLGESVRDLDLDVYRETSFLIFFLDESTGRYVSVLQEGQTQVFSEDISVDEKDLDEWVVAGIKGPGELERTVEVFIKRAR